jgi:hypothetical protein
MIADRLGITAAPREPPSGSAYNADLPATIGCRIFRYSHGAPPAFDMSTTFDPSKEAALHLLGTPASLNGNGKADDGSLAQLAARAGFWGKSAPKSLRKQRLAFDEALNLYWSDRKRRPSIAELCGADRSPLEWGLVADAISPGANELIKIVARQADDSPGEKTRRKELHEAQSALSTWLDGAQSQKPGYDLGLGCLAATALIDEHGEALSPLLRWRLLEFLASTARHAPHWNLGAEASPEDVVASQLLGGELPLTLAYLFGEMTPLAKLAKPAADFISASMLELLNGQGLTRAAHLRTLRPLLACWTRCQAMARDVKGCRLAKKASRQFERLVRQALRWTAPDGTTLLTKEGGDAWTAAFLRSALKLGGTKKDVAAVAALVGGEAAASLEAAKKGPEAAYDCEWAGLAVLRRDWSPADAVVAVDYSRPQMRLDVWAGRRLLGGPVLSESHVNGQLLRAAGPWENTCWFKDKEVNYLELTLPLQEGARIDRQILLALKDDFLLLVDNLHAPEAGELQHAWQAPMGPSLLFCGEGETRDALLVDGEPVARLLPLALPEWRLDPRVGELSLSGGAVRLSERATGRALACPLFIDLNAARSAEQCTWRQLTVAEQLQIQPADAAVSYRIQSGKDQWVYYRSQGRRGNRTFLGQNTSSECYIARFKAPSGEVHELLEIEG